MPWKKQFDEDEIVEAAMKLFWQRGYQRVSVADLVEELGVNRSSLYTTYEHKEGLFREALLRYDRVHRQEWFEDLSARFEPLESIRQAFAEMSMAPEPTRRFGCLLVNTTLELPSGEFDFAEVVRAAFDATERFFEQQLELAETSGDLPGGTDTPALAATLLALFLGMRVLARVQRPADTNLPILRQVDAMLQH